jgi:hypothetical protein
MKITTVNSDRNSFCSAPASEAALIASADSKQQFDREAKAISQPNHPNICTRVDVGDLDGRPLPLPDVVKIGLERSPPQWIVHTEPGSSIAT